MAEFTNMNELINYFDENVIIKHTDEDIEKIKEIKEIIKRNEKIIDGRSEIEPTSINYNIIDDNEMALNYHYEPNKYITLLNFLEKLKAQNLLTKFLTQFINHIFGNTHNNCRNNIIDLYLVIENNLITYRKQYKSLIINLSKFLCDNLTIYNISKIFESINYHLKNIYNFNQILTEEYDFIKNDILEYLIQKAEYFNF